MTTAEAVQALLEVTRTNLTMNVIGRVQDLVELGLQAAIIFLLLRGEKRLERLERRG